MRRGFSKLLLWLARLNRPAAHRKLGESEQHERRATVAANKLRAVHCLPLWIEDDAGAWQREAGHKLSRQLVHRSEESEWLAPSMATASAEEVLEPRILHSGLPNARRLPRAAASRSARLFPVASLVIF